MFEYILLGTFVLLVVTLVAFNFYKNAKESKELTNGVINYNDMKTEFIFNVNKNREEIIACLTEHQEADILEYDYFSEDNRIVLKKYGNSNLTYNFIIVGNGENSLIRLVKIEKSFNRNDIPNYINKFIISKLGAEAIPYFK